MKKSYFRLIQKSDFRDSFSSLFTNMQHSLVGSLWRGGRINTADPLKKQETSLEQFRSRKEEGRMGPPLYCIVLMVLEYEGHLSKCS